MKKILFLSFLCFFIFSLISCSKIEENSSKPPFDYLRAFGGISKEEGSRIFPLKDGTFYVVSNTSSPALNGNIPKSMHLKYYDFIKNKEKAVDKSDIWLFQIDPNKPYNKQIIYSRCFGGSEGEELWSACLDENENIIIGTKSGSTDGDVDGGNSGDCWIFRVDTKKPYKEQITYSQKIPRPCMWTPLDIKFIDKDTCYILYNEKYEDEAFIYSLMKLDLSKKAKNIVFTKRIFFTDSLCSYRSTFVIPHISISDNGIISMVWMIEKDKLYSPLNIDRNISYKETNTIDSEPIDKMDILVLSLDPNLPETDWIVYSRIIGGSKADVYPKILKAENESFWISFFTKSEDGDMEDNVINMINDDSFFNASLAIMKINPTLSKDKQIEYVKFIQADRSFIRSPYYDFCVYGDELDFLFGIKNIDSKNRYTEMKTVNLTENQKKKNLTLPYLNVEEEYFAKPGYCKFFALDTKTDKCYFHNFKVSADGNPYISRSDSYLYFSIDSCCPPKMGDMPDYKQLGFTDILVGKIGLKNMKEIPDTEKK